jgi:hypothetical protein
MTISDRLQAKLNAANAKPAPRSFNRWNYVGVALGLTLAGGAFLYGMAHPTNDLPTIAAGPDWRTKVSYADPAKLGEPVVAQPVVQPVVQAAARSEMKWDRAGALGEMCVAGRQYREDVDSGYAGTADAEEQVRLYARHLSGDSPVSVGELVKAGMRGLVTDHC